MADRNQSSDAVKTASNTSAASGPASSRGGHIHVRPNKMTYQDGNGVQRSIYIPREAYEQVNKLFVEKDWEGLARFPVWSKATFSPLQSRLISLLTTLSWRC